MNYLPEFSWVIASIILIIISFHPYIQAILQQKVERLITSTQILWLIIAFLLIATNYSAGENFETGLGLIFIWAFLSSGLPREKLDNLFIFSFLILTIIWRMTDSWFLALFTGSIVYLLVFAIDPIILEKWKPRDEIIFPWLVFCVGGSLSILATSELNIKNWLFPVYMTIGGTLIALPIIFSTIKKN